MPGREREWGPEAEPQALDLQKWLHLFLENRWWIIGVTGFCVIVALLYSFLATPIYSATATVYVQSQGRQIINSQSLMGSSSWLEEEKFFNSQKQVITSKEVAQAAVDRLKLRDTAPFKDSKDPASLLRGMVRAENVRDTALFKITVTGPYPKDVAAWANGVAEAYAEMSLRNAMEYISKANRLMLDEARRMQEEYARQQKQLTGELVQTGSYFPQNQKEIVDQGIGQLETKLQEVRVQQSEVGANVGLMQAALARGSDPLSLPAVAQDPTAQELARQIAEAQRELGRLETKLTPQHPDVKKKQKELDGLRGRLADQAGVILASYRNRYAALKSEEASLLAGQDSLKRQGLEYAEGSTRGETMQTSATAVKKYMDLLYDKMREMNLAGSLLTNNIRTVDPAMPPGGPIKPNKRMNLMLAFLLGLMLSAGSLVAYQYLDTSIKSVEDVEQGMGINLLAMVPSLEQETERATVEAFQALRTALIYASQNNQRNVVLITSANPKEGKSSVVSNLANIMAAAGDRVLLMDCDLRRPTIHRFLTAPEGHKGLTHYLASKGGKIEDFLYANVQPNLSVVYSGPIPPNPPELFSMKRFKDLLVELRGKYDWVLLDSPPCLSITDAQLLASEADLVLLVARYKQTAKPLLQRALLMLRRLDASVAGLVLNDVETRSSYYYDYYYSSHYYYTTGVAPKRLPWILGKAGAWTGLWEAAKHRRRQSRGGKS